MFGGFSGAYFRPWKIRSTTQKGDSNPVVFHDTFGGDKKLSEVLNYMIDYKSTTRNIVKIEITR